MEQDIRGRKLNWRQACAVLGCGKDFFYRLVREGRLPAYRTQGCGRGLWVYELDCLRLVRPVSELCRRTEAKP